MKIIEAPSIRAIFDVAFPWRFPVSAPARQVDPSQCCLWCCLASHAGRSYGVLSISGANCRLDMIFRQLCNVVSQAKATECVFFFRECVAKGSRFTVWRCLEVWGWRRVRVTLLLVSATVRARPSWQKSCPVYRRCAHVVLRGRRGTLWHSMCFSRNLCARPSWG